MTTTVAHPQLVVDDALAPAVPDHAGALDWTHPQLAPDLDVIDLFAAGGGWDEGSRAVPSIDHHRILGIEWDEPACRTAVAAGFRRLMADIALLNPRDLVRRAVRGLIASPPCQGFSMAGDGGGRRDTPLILEAVERIYASDLSEGAVTAVLTWLRGVCEDEKSALVLEPLRWALILGPEWTAWEQVTAVLPLWQAIARVLRKAGYKVWTGVLNSADYGVPQTRRRAILIASRVGYVSMPEPTHAKGGSEGDLFSDPLPPWISMAQALGWGMTDRVGFPRLAASDQGDPASLEVARIAGVEYRARDLTVGDEPAQTVTEKARSWQRWPAGAVELLPGVEGRNLAVRGADEPAPTVAFGNNAAQWQWRLRDDGTQEPADPANVVYVNGTHDHAARRPASEPAPTIMFGERLNTVTWQEAQETRPEDAEVTFEVEVPIRADQPMPDARMFGFPVPVHVDASLPPDVIEIRDTDGNVLGEFRTHPEKGYMLAGGIAGDAVPRSVDEPSPTLSGAGAACWISDPSQWIRHDRLASQETPKGQRLGGAADRRPPQAGELRVELRRGGDRIEEGFDPATEPSATVTTRVDRWQIKTAGKWDGPGGIDPDGPATTVTGDPRLSPRSHHGPGEQGANAVPSDAVREWYETRPAPTIVTTRRSKDGLIVGRRLPEGESVAVGGWGWDATQTFCLFCRCTDDHHDADGACSGCQAGLIGGDLPHCTWEAWVETAGLCDRCAGLLALATGVCTACGHDQLGYYDDMDGFTPGDQVGPHRPHANAPDLATLKVWGDRPATTVVASRNPDIISGPGYRGPGAASRQEAPGGVRVTVAEAAILQSFPASFPWQGTKTKQYQAVGNAVPPLLAAHILAEATGTRAESLPHIKETWSWLGI